MLQSQVRTMTKATDNENKMLKKSNSINSLFTFSLSFSLDDSNKLLSLLNLLCNSTQNSSITVRDACYGCFFRVGVLTPGAALLNQLSQCANIYLANTSYAGCASQLAVSR